MARSQDYGLLVFALPWMMWRKPQKRIPVRIALAHQKRPLGDQISDNRFLPQLMAFLYDSLLSFLSLYKSAGMVDIYFA